MQLIIEDNRDIDARFTDLVADIIMDSQELVREWIATNDAGEWAEITRRIASSHSDSYYDLLHQRKKYESIELSLDANWPAWTLLYFRWDTFPDSEEYLLLTFYMPRHYVSSSVYQRSYLI